MAPKWSKTARFWTTCSPTPTPPDHQAIPRGNRHPPDDSNGEIVTTEKYSDVSVDSSNTVTITGGEGGHDFGLSIDGTFSGGSTRRTITESTEIKVNDAVTYDFKRETLHASSFNNGSMTIEIDGDFGDATVYSGTFAMRLTMSTSAGDSTYEVRENGVLVDRDNTTYHGISNDYEIGVELTGPGFTFDFEADGGNSMTGSTHQSLDTQTTMAVKQSDASHDYVLVFTSAAGTTGRSNPAAKPARWKGTASTASTWWSRRSVPAGRRRAWRTSRRSG